LIILFFSLFWDFRRINSRIKMKLKKKERKGVSFWFSLHFFHQNITCLIAFEHAWASLQPASRFSPFLELLLCFTESKYSDKIFDSFFRLLPQHQGIMIWEGKYCWLKLWAYLIHQPPRRSYFLVFLLKYFFVNSNDYFW